MDIKQILSLPDNVSGLSCSGTVDYTQDAKNRTGVSNGKPYNFWTQFFVLVDASGDIGVNLNLGNSPANAVRKGQQVVIERATITSYLSGNEVKRSLKGFLTQNTPQNSHSSALRPAQSTNSTDKPDWGAISRGKVRHGVVCAYIQNGQEPDIATIEFWVDYIMTGQRQYQPTTSKNPNDYDANEVPDDNLPF